jgi:hypothetical protein
MNAFYLVVSVRFGTAEIEKGEIWLRDIISCPALAIIAALSVQYFKDGIINSIW